MLTQPRCMLTSSALAGIAAGAVGVMTARADDVLVQVHVGHTEQGYVPGVTIGSGAELVPLTDRPTGNFFMPLYIALGDEQTLVTLDEAGEAVPLADLSMIGLAAPPWSFSIDTWGDYGGALYLNDDANRVYEISVDGIVSLFALNEADQVHNTALAFDPHGAFEGRLFLTDSSGSLHTIETNGEITTVATDLGGAGHHLAFSPGGAFGEDLFVADVATRRIFRISPTHAASEAPPVWVDLAAPELDVVPANLTIGSDGIMYVEDADSDRIVALGPDGAPLSERSSGFDFTASIELPRAEAGDVLALLTQWGPCLATGSPSACPADLDGDGFVGVVDLTLLLGNEP